MYGFSHCQRYKRVLKTISIVVLVFFVSNILGNDIALAINMPLDANTFSPESMNLDLAGEKSGFSLPEHLGTIQDSWSSDKLSTFHSPLSTVIHIQDAHSNYACQKSISEIIKYCADEYGVKNVYLEGGKGEYDLSLFQQIPDVELRGRVSEYFLKAGQLNAAEYFGINNPDKVSLWGVEDSELYLKNLSVYRNSLSYKINADMALKEINHILNSLKIKIFSKELLQFDAKYIQYKKGNIEFKEYLQFMLEIANKYMDSPVPSASLRTGKPGNDKEGISNGQRYPNILLLSRTLKQEKTIDFKRADIERDLLIDIFLKQFPKRKLKELTEKIVGFKDNRMSDVRFYGYIVKKAVEAGINIQREFPELAGFIGYLSAYSKTDNMSLMNEIELLEDQLRNVLAENDIQKELISLSKNLEYIKNICNFTLTKKGYDYYTGNKVKFNISEYTSFINKYSPIYNIQAKLSTDAKDLDQYIKKIIPFYEFSQKRDEAFIRNIIKEQWGRVTVLITGGFHTENLSRLFRENGISYVSVVPKFSQQGHAELVSASQNSYFDLLAGKESEFGLIGKMDSAVSSLQIPSKLNAALGQKIWGERNIQLYEASVYVQTLVEKGNTIKIVDDTTGDEIFSHGVGENIIRVTKNKFFYDIHEEFIDRVMGGDEEDYRDLNLKERQAAQAAKEEVLFLLTREDPAYREIKNIDAAEFVRVSKNLSETGRDGHAGGCGIRIQDNLSGERIQKIVRHELLAGIVKNHKAIEKLEELIGTDNGNAEIRQILMSSENRYENYDTLWDITDRTDIERDYADKNVPNPVWNNGGTLADVRRFFEEQSYLTAKERKEIVEFILKFHEEFSRFLRVLAKRSDDPARYTVSIREIKRFAQNFKRVFLKLEKLAGREEAFERAKEDVVRNIYLDFINFDTMEKMAEEETNSGVIDITAGRSLDEAFHDILDWLPWAINSGVPPLVRRLSGENIFNDTNNKLKRGLDSSIPTLFIKNKDSLGTLEVALSEYSKEKNAQIFNLQCTPFSDTSQLIGGYIPRERVDVEAAYRIIRKIIDDDKKVSEVLGVILRKDSSTSLGMTDKSHPASPERSRRERAERVEGSVSKEEIREFRNAYTRKSINGLIIVAAMAIEFPFNWRKKLTYEKGILPRLIEMCGKDKEKTFVLNFENIEALSGGVRAQLNTFLLTGEVQIPWAEKEEDRKLNMPANLRIMGTMNENAVLEDGAFYDRFIRKTIPTGTSDDLSAAIARKYPALNGDVKQLIVKFKEKFDEYSIPYSLTDFMTVSAYIEGRIEKKGISTAGFSNRKFIATCELEYYFEAFSREYRDKSGEILRALSLVTDVGAETYYLTYEKGSGELIFKEVGLKINKIIAEKIEQVLTKNNWPELPAEQEKIIKQVLINELDYVVTNEEKKMLASIARSYKFGNGVVLLEGATGTGKTYTAEVLSKLLDFGDEDSSTALGMTADRHPERAERVERSKRYYAEPIHAGTKLSRFTGVFKADEYGFYSLDRKTEFLNIIENGGVAALSEMNTAVKNDYAKLAWWFTQFARGDEEIYLTENPGYGQDGEISPKVKRHKKSLIIIDVNPEDYAARGKLPEELLAYAPRVRVDGMKSRDEIEEVANAFLGHVKDESTRKEMSSWLADVHFQLQENIEEENKLGNRHPPLTFRELRRISKTIGDNDDRSQAVKNMSKAINTYYVMAFKKISKQRELQNEFGILSDRRNVKDIIKDLMFGSKDAHAPPTLVFTPAEENPFQELDALVKEQGDNVYCEKIQTTYFLDDFKLFGGFVPITDNTVIARSAKGATKQSILKYSKEWQAKLKYESGIIPRLVNEAKNNPQKTYIIAFENFHRIRPGLAVALNTILQEGYYYDPFEKGPVSIPENLKFFASAIPEAELPISMAEESRWVRIYKGEKSKDEKAEILKNYAVTLLAKEIENGITGNILIETGFLNNSGGIESVVNRIAHNLIACVADSNFLDSFSLSDHRAFIRSSIKELADNNYILSSPTGFLIAIEKHRYLVYSTALRPIERLEQDANGVARAYFSVNGKYSDMRKYFDKFLSDKNKKKTDLRNYAYKCVMDKLKPMLLDRDDDYYNDRLRREKSIIEVWAKDVADKAAEPVISRLLSKDVKFDVCKNVIRDAIEEFSEVWPNEIFTLIYSISILQGERDVPVFAILEKEVNKYISATERILNEKPELISEDSDLLVEIDELVEVENATFQAFQDGRIVVYEGPPGGGKTDMAIDAARRMGLDSHVYSCHGRVHASDILGGFIQGENGEFILTGQPDADGNYPYSPFLQMLTHGGVFIFDEGAIGRRSQELISLLSFLARGEKDFILNEIPGMPAEILKVHKDFHIVITMNPAEDTPGREPLPLEVYNHAKKIWISNELVQESYRLVIKRFLQRACRKYGTSTAKIFDTKHLPGFIPEDSKRLLKLAGAEPDWDEGIETRQYIKYFADLICTVHNTINDMIGTRISLEESENLHLLTLRDMKKAVGTFVEYVSKGVGRQEALRIALRVEYINQFNEADRKEIEKEQKNVFAEEEQKGLVDSFKEHGIDVMSFINNLLNDLDAKSLDSQKEETDSMAREVPGLSDEEKEINHKPENTPTPKPVLSEGITEEDLRKTMNFAEAKEIFEGQVSSMDKVLGKVGMTTEAVNFRKEEIFVKNPPEDPKGRDHPVIFSGHDDVLEYRGSMWDMKPTDEAAFEERKVESVKEFGHNSAEMKTIFLKDVPEGETPDIVNHRQTEPKLRELYKTLKATSFPGVAAMTSINLGGKTYIAAAIDDLENESVIELWDMTKGEENVTVLRSDNMKEIMSLAVINTDGRECLVSGIDEGLFEIWDIDIKNAKGTVTTVISKVKFTGCLSTTRINGKEYLATGHTHGTIKLWNFSKGTEEVITLRGHIGTIEALYSTTIYGKEYLVSAGSDNTVRLWQISEEERSVITLEGHKETVFALTSLRASDGKEYIVSGAGHIDNDNDNTIKLWDISPEPKKKEGTVITLDGHTDRIGALCNMEINGEERLISGAWDNMIKVWDPFSREKTVTVLDGHTNIIRALLPFQIGSKKYLFSGADKENIKMWDFNMRSEMKKAIHEQAEWQRSQLKQEIIRQPTDPPTREQVIPDYLPEEKAITEARYALRGEGRVLLIVRPGARENVVIGETARREGIERISSMEGAPGVTLQDILGGLSPVFEDEPDEGDRVLKYKKGFFTRYMEKEGEPRATSDERRLLVIHNIDAIGEKVRAAVNNLLLKGYVYIPGEGRYYLRENVKLIATISSSSQREFASAFPNRLTKVNVGAMKTETLGVSQFKEYILKTYFRGYSKLNYGVTEDMVDRIEDVFCAIRDLEFGGYIWPSGNAYEFTVKDALTHAKFVLLGLKEKGAGNAASFDNNMVTEIIIREAIRVYGARVQEYKRDYEEFMNTILPVLFEGESEEAVKAEISGALSGNFTLAGGRLGSISGIPLSATEAADNPYNIDKRYRLTLVGSMVKTISSVVRGFQSRKVTVLAGETGTSKTTMGAAIAKFLGLEYYIFSTHKDVKSYEVTAGIRMTDEGAYKQELSEFAKRLKRGNVVLIVDEANIKPEILWILAGIARGDRKFTIEVPGDEPVSFETGKDVFVLFTMNPEAYGGGRGAVPGPLKEDVFSIWSPSEYSDGELEAITNEFFDGFSELDNVEEKTKEVSDEKVPDIDARMLDLLKVVNYEYAALTTEEVIKEIDKKGHKEGLMGMLAGRSREESKAKREEFRKLEQEILEMKEVQKKMNSIRTLAPIIAKSWKRVKIRFSIFSWWSINPEGTILNVPLYELVDYKSKKTGRKRRSVEAIKGFIFHEVWHKRFTPTLEEYTDMVKKIDKPNQAAVDLIGVVTGVKKDHALHRLWNALEDIRINHIQDPRIKGGKRYFDAFGKELFEDMLGAENSEKKQMVLHTAAVQPHVTLVNELLCWGYNGKHSTYFKYLNPELQNDVKVLTEGEKASLRRATIDDMSTISKKDWDNIKTGKIDFQTEKLRAAEHSLRVILKEINPVYQKWLKKAKVEDKGEEMQGPPQFVDLPPELADGLDPSDSSHGDTIIGEDGETMPAGKPSGGEDDKEGADDKGGVGSVSSGSRANRNSEAMRRIRNKRREEMKKEPFNQRLSEVNSLGKRLAESLINIFRVPDEPEIEESAYGRLINAIRFLTSSNVPFDEEIERDGKPDLALGFTVDASGSMSSFYDALKRLSAIMLSSFQIIGRKGEFSVTIDGNDDDRIDAPHTIKGFKDRFSNEELNGAQSKLEERINRGGSGIHLYECIEEIINKYKKSDKRNKLEIVFTDGEDTGGDWIGSQRSERLEKLFKEAEKMGIDIIGVGFKGEDDIKVFDSYIQLDMNNCDAMVGAILNVARIKARTGKVPKGDLGGVFDLERGGTVRRDASQRVASSKTGGYAVVKSENLARSAVVPELTQRSKTDFSTSLKITESGHSERAERVEGSIPNEVKGQAVAAQDIIPDLWRNTTKDIVILPETGIYESNEIRMRNRVVRGMRKKHEQFLVTLGYIFNKDWKQGFKDEILRAVLLLDKGDEKMRALAYVPALSSIEDKTFIKKLLKETDIAPFASRITIIQQEGLQKDVSINIVMQIILAEALLNYERYRKDDYPGEIEPSEKLRLEALIKTMVDSPEEIGSDFIDNLINGITLLKMRKMDFESIERWEELQDYIRTSA